MPMPMFFPVVDVYIYVDYGGELGMVLGCHHCCFYDISSSIIQLLFDNSNSQGVFFQHGPAPL